MKTSTPYYAIEIIGYSHKKYCIKKVVSSTTVIPYDRKTYNTINDAQNAARNYGLTIEKAGDCYRILP